MSYRKHKSQLKHSIKKIKKILSNKSELSNKKIIKLQKKLKQKQRLLRDIGNNILTKNKNKKFNFGIYYGVGGSDDGKDTDTMLEEARKTSSTTS